MESTDDVTVHPDAVDPRHGRLDAAASCHRPHAVGTTTATDIARSVGI